MKEAYHKTLKERLPSDEIDDPDARDRALRPEIDWFRAQVTREIDDRTYEGKTRSNLKQALKPALDLVHLSLAYLLHSRERCILMLNIY